jgi:3-dehydroquinate synthetase
MHACIGELTADKHILSRVKIIIKEARGIPMPTRHVATRYGLIVALLMIAIVASHLLFEEPVHAFVNHHSSAASNPLGIAVAIFTGLATDILLPIPSSVLSIWAVINYGFISGFVLVWLGMSTACILGYLLGAGAGNRFLMRFFSTQDIHSAQQLTQRYGTGALIFSRAVPVLAEASVVAAGIARMPFAAFLRVTLLSNAGIALAYSAAGAWANASTSFILAFAGSIILPMSALGIFRFVQKLKSSSQHLPQTAFTNDQLNPSFSVNFSYPLSFTQDAFHPQNTLLVSQLRRNRAENTAIKLQFFVDQEVLNSHPGLTAKIEHYCKHHQLNLQSTPIAIPGGEAAKNHAQIERMHDHMLTDALDRHAYVIAIGGGGLLDAVGYAASTFHRGMRLVRMPTTVLAQNDAGVGVKNGINSNGLKNLLGCFAVPHAIINDAEFLQTLSNRDFRAGFAEAIKVALIRDSHFFHWICEHRAELFNREPKTNHWLIRRCAELHLNQICNGGDPFEMGSARPLDYGHWSAHKLETLTQHELCHGEAVAIGMALDTLYAVEIGLLKRADAEMVLQLLHDLGFNIWHPSLEWVDDEGTSALIKGLEEFRQHLGGRLCITLLTSIGETFEADAIDHLAMLSARDKLKGYSESVLESSNSTPELTV